LNGAPDLSVLDKKLPWPAMPADSGPHVKLWATRCLIHMVAKGRRHAGVVNFAIHYHLDFAAIIADAGRQAALLNKEAPPAPSSGVLLGVEPTESIRDNRRKRRN